MSLPPPRIVSKTLVLPSPDATAALGEWLAEHVEIGDCLLLSGSIGAGKSHLARAMIRRLLALHRQPPEDIPSPTYTLVQTYDCGGVEVWHADLYRLTSPDEVFELGLETAFSEAICLIEWPDRLGGATPPDALTIALCDTAEGSGRIVRLSGLAPKWDNLLALPASFEVSNAPTG